MPKIDPQTNEPLSDDPDGPAALRGGKVIGDPDLADASVNGGNARKADELGPKDGALPGDVPSAQ